MGWENIALLHDWIPGWRALGWVKMHTTLHDLTSQMQYNSKNVNMNVSSEALLQFLPQLAFRRCTIVVEFL